MGRVSDMYQQKQATGNGRVQQLYAAKGINTPDANLKTVENSTLLPESAPGTTSPSFALPTVKTTTGALPQKGSTVTPLPMFGVSHEEPTVQSMVQSIKLPAELHNGAKASLAGEQSASKSLAMQLNDVNTSIGSLTEELSQINNGTAIHTQEGKARAAEIEQQLASLREQSKALESNADLNYEDYLDVKYEGKSDLYKAAASIGKTFTSAPDVIVETFKTALQNTKDNYSTDTAEDDETAALVEELSQINNGTAIHTQEGKARAAEIEKRLAEIQGQDASVDMDSSAMRGMQEASWLTNAATENIESPTGKFLANTGLSIAQNAALLPTAAINPAIPLVAMGTVAGAQKMYDVSASGGSAGQALGRGIVAGGIEALTEKLPLDTVADLVKTGGKSAVKNILKQAFVEATEEGLSYAMNFIADKVADGDATFSIWELLQSAAAGGLSGAFFGAGGTAIGTAANTTTNEKTQNNALLPTTPVQQAATATNGVLPTAPLSEQKTAPSAVKSAEAATPKITMADFTDVNSPVWNNVDYNDTAKQTEIMREAHQEMVDSGSVVTIPDTTVQDVSQSYPDLRTMKKSERTPILRQKINELKKSLRQTLNGLKGGYEFTVNGNVLEATLYDTGVKEVMEKITQDKASMLYHSDQIFENAQYLYSTPDYDGDPNVYRWNYFYTPVQIGDETVGVRIAVRDVANPQESQIYNWGIKKDATLDGEGRGQNRIPSDVSSVASTKNPLVTESDVGVSADPAHNAQSVPPSGPSNQNVTQLEPIVNRENVGIFGPDTVGAASRAFKYQEADTQSVADRMFTDEELETYNLRNTHQVYSDAEANAAVDQLLANDYAGEVERLQDENTIWGKTENVEGHRILEDLTAKARKSGSAADWKAVTEWKKLWDTRGGTEVGQAMQARAQFVDSAATITAEAADFLDSDKAKKLKPEKKKQLRETIYDQSEKLENIEAGDTDSLIALIERNNEIRRTTGMFNKKTAKTMDWALHEIVKSYPDTAESFLRDVATSQIRNISLDYSKTSVIKAVKSYRLAGMLSKIATVLRNVVSNTIFDFTETFSTDAGVVADMLMSTVTGQRTTAVDKSWFSKAKRRGAAEGALKSYIEVGLDAPVEDTSSRYEGTGESRTFKMTGNLVERWLSTWAKWENYALKTTDEFAKGGVRAETQRGINKLKESGKLSGDALSEWADETAKQRTFQNDGKAAKAVSFLKRGANMLAVKDSTGESFGAGDLALPFAKVPANLGAQSVNYTTLAGLKSFGQAVKVMIDAKNGKYNPQAQAQAALNIGRGITGSAMTAIFAALALKGLIAVAGADDKDKEALGKAQGRTGTQWNLSATWRAINGESTEWQDGDIITSLGYLEPANAQMAMGALLADAYKEDGKISVKDYASATLGSLFQVFQDLPAVTSLNDIMNAYKYSDAETTAGKVGDALLEYSASQVSSFILPNALRGIAVGLDDKVRDQYAGETWYEDAWNSIKSGVPGLRGTLPVAYDNYGREKTQTGSTILNLLNNNVLPGAFTKYKETELEKELSSLYDATGDASIYPDKSAPSSVQYDNTKYDLTSEERSQYQQTAGQYAETLQNGILNSDYYKDASYDEKVEAMSDALSFARDLAKREVLESRGIKYKSNSWEKAYTVTKSGIGFDVYLEYKYLKSELDETLNTTDTNSAIRDELYSDGRLTDKQKQVLDDNLLSDGIYIPKDVSVDYSNSETFTITQMSDSAQARWPGIKSEFGITADQYVEAWSIYNNDDLSANEKKAQLRDLVGTRGNTLYTRLGERLN